MSGDHTLEIGARLSMMDLHTLLWMLQANREVTVKMTSPTAVADWHEIELQIIARHEARVRRIQGR